MKKIALAALVTASAVLAGTPASENKTPEKKDEKTAPATQPVVAATAAQQPAASNVAATEAAAKPTTSEAPKTEAAKPATEAGAKPATSEAPKTEAAKPTAAKAS